MTEVLMEPINWPEQEGRVGQADRFFAHSLQNVVNTEAPEWGVPIETIIGAHGSPPPSPQDLEPGCDVFLTTPTATQYHLNPPISTLIPFTDWGHNANYVFFELLLCGLVCNKIRRTIGCAHQAPSLLRPEANGRLVHSSLQAPGVHWPLVAGGSVLAGMNVCFTTNVNICHWNAFFILFHHFCTLTHAFFI